MSVRNGIYADMALSLSPMHCFCTMIISGQAAAANECWGTDKHLVVREANRWQHHSLVIVAVHTCVDTVQYGSASGWFLDNLLQLISCLQMVVLQSVCVPIDDEHTVRVLGQGPGCGPYTLQGPSFTSGG